MSQTAIGRAALILSTNGTGLRTGLASEKQHATSWADSTAAGINSRLKNVGKGFGTGGLFATAGRIAAPAAAAIAGVVGVREAIQTLYDVAKSGVAAKSFGLTAEEFTGIQGLAATTGEQSREFLESLVTLGKLAEEGAKGIGTVAPNWFKALNIDAKEFAKLKVDERLYKVFDAIDAAGPNVDKVRAVMAPFGEDGGKFLFTLTSKAPAELRAMAKSFAISTAEVEKATAAHAELSKASTTLSAGWRAVVIAMAPGIGRVAQWIGDLRPKFEWLGRAIEGVGDVAGPVFTEIGGWIRSTAAAAGQWIGTVTGMGDSTLEVGQVIQLAFRGIGTAGAYAWDTIKFGAGAVFTALGYFISGLSYLTDAFAGLVNLAKKLPDAMKPSWLNEFADGVQATSDLVQGTGRELRQWGDDAMSGWGNSADKFNTWMDKLGNRTKQQAKAAAAETVAAATQAAAALTKIDNGALIRGSSAEVNYRVKHDFGSGSPQAKMLEEQKRANKELIGINVGVKKVADRLADRGELATV